MSWAEIVAEIPKLSFEQKQELVRLAMAEGDELSAADHALLDARMEDFRRNPEAGIPLEQLKDYVRDRIGG